MIFHLKYDNHYILLQPKIKVVRSLKPEIARWLYDQRIPYIVDFVKKPTIRIPDETHALLFKLTWM